MKHQPFARRLSYAVAGIRYALTTEASFRTQALGALVALMLLIVTQATPIWWAAFALTTAGVLSAELINTALELFIDRLHPDQNEQIGRAKDCAAAAVLVFSLASLVVALSLIFQTWIDP